MNPFVPGSPIDDRATTVSTAASAGTTRAMPPKSAIILLCRRS